MKKFLYSALMLITFCSIASNLNAQMPDTIWTKLIDCIGENVSLAGIVPTSNGGFFMVYTFRSSLTDNRNIYYGKLNSTGDVVFYQIYNPDPNLNYTANSITPTYDGGIIITGKVWDEASTSTLLVKLNANCVFQWDKVIANTSGKIEGLKSIQTAQGFTVLSEAWNPPQNIKYAVLIKTDEVGNVLDSETYTDELPLIPYDIVRTQDNSFVFVCELSSPLPIRMYKVDETLNIVWMHPLGLPLGDFPTSPLCLINSICGGFLIGGITFIPDNPPEWDKLGVLIKTHSNGFLQDYNVYGDTLADIGIIIHSIIEFQDESVLSAGALLIPSQRNMLLMKTNPQMDTIYCMNLRNVAEAYSVIKCVDGNIVVGGISLLDESLYLVKLESDIPSYTIGNEGLGIAIEDNQIVSNNIYYPPLNKKKNQLSSTLVGVDVMLDSITHTSTGDLEFTLSHNGVVDTLVFHAGGNGNDFTYTVLSDQAQIPVNLSLPPFIGDYKPYSPLTKFSGMDATGEWTLSILDNVTGNTGMLHAWGLRFYFEGPVGVDDETPEIISDYMLYQNYPNPFNPSTVINYQLPVSGNVTLKIYDVLGNEITTLVDEYKPAGSYEVEFSVHSDEGQNLPSGVYFYQLRVGGPETSSEQGIIQAKKMILLK